MMQDAKITSVASGKQLFIDITPGPSPDAPSIFCAFAVSPHSVPLD
jgi:hypothetical protein